MTNGLPEAPLLFPSLPDEGAQVVRTAAPAASTWRQYDAAVLTPSATRASASEEEEVIDFA